MSGLAFISSPTIGHGCWPPTMISQGSSTVFVNGLPAAAMGNAIIPHTCVAPPFPTHAGVVAQGSTSVFIEGSPAARIGDMTSCGDMIAMGSPNVLVG